MKLARNITLPPDTVARTIAILAQKGAGKTYAAMKLTELMLDEGSQVCCLDPTGVWWGLKAEGKGAGYPIIVMGGAKADVPLEHTSGKIVADFLVNSGQSIVLDLSHFSSNTQQDQFVAEFAERLYRNKAHTRTPLHLMLDEADSFAPQNPRHGGWAPVMLGAIEAIVRRGRSRGLGMTMISQRPAVLNKNVLTQCDLLIAMRIVGIQDHKALREWTRMHGTQEQLDNFESILPTLPNGHAVFWSPEWLKCFEEHKILERRTFDASKTPETGMSTKAPKLAQTDLAKLTAEIRATLEKAKENDPKELKAEITRLKKDIQKLETENREVHIENKQLMERKPEGLTEADKKLIEGVKEAARELLKPMPSIQKQLEQLVGLELAQRIMPPKPDATNRVPKRIPDPMPEGMGYTYTPPKRTVPAGKPGWENNGAITGGKRRMMIALAQRPGLNARQLGVRAGLSSKSGTFGTYLASLRAAGWLQGGRDSMRLTSEGESKLGHYDPLPTGSALLEFWLQELGGGGKARMLQELAKAYPNVMTKAELGEAADISPNSGTFGTYLAALRTLELISGSGELKASDELFD